MNGLGELSNLAWLDLVNIKCTPGLREIGRLKELQMLRLVTVCSGDSLMLPYRTTGDSQALELPNLDKCIRLKELVVECGCLKALPDLRGMTSLITASFTCKAATEGLGLDPRFSALQSLSLYGCKVSLADLPRLGEVLSFIEDLPVQR